MSAIQMAPNASGTGTLSIASPNTNTNRTLTLPDQTGTFVTTSGVNAVGQIPFSTDGSTYTATAKIVSGTAVASTSGTSIDFTSIPSWVKRITVMFNGVSTNGSSVVRVRIGPSGGVETSGYLGASGTTLSASAAALNFTAGFDFADGGASTTVRHGAVFLTLIDPSTNTWIVSGSLGQSDIARGFFLGGTKPLAGVLSRVQITTVNGTDTFDAGSINLLWE